MTLETIARQFKQNTHDLFKDEPKLLFVKFDKNVFLESAQYIIDMLNEKKVSFRILKDISCLLIPTVNETEAGKLKGAIDELYLLYLPVFYLHQCDTDQWLFNAQNKIDSQIGFQGCNYIEPSRENEIKDIIENYSDFHLLKNINFTKEKEAICLVSSISKEDFIDHFVDFMMTNSTFFIDKKNAIQFINTIYDIESATPLKDVRDMNVSTNIIFKAITDAFVAAKQDIIKTDKDVLNEVATLLKCRNINDFIKKKETPSYDMKLMHNLVNPDHSMSENDDAEIMNINNHHISNEINCRLFSRNNSYMCEMEHSVHKTSHIASLIGENVRHFIAIKKLDAINQELLTLSKKVIDPHFSTTDFTDKLSRIFN